MTENTDSSILFNAYKFIFSGTATGEDDATDLGGALLTSVKKKDDAVTAVLTKQKQVNNILQSELNRLEIKKEQLDNAQKGQERVLMMNESYRKRQSEYIKISIVVVIVFTLVILMRYMRIYFNVLPDAVSTTIHILLFASLIVYSIVTHINILSRDKINYDRLSLPAPYIDSADSEKRDVAAKKAGDLLGISDSNLCKGASCCTEGENSWDQEAGKCIHDPE